MNEGDPSEMILDGDEGEYCSFLEGAMPSDATCLILNFLYLTDLQHLSVCSRRLNDIVTQTTSVYMDEAFDQLPRTTHFHRRVEPFVERPVRLEKWELVRMLDRFSNLKELHLTGLAPIGDALLNVLNQATAASTVESLTLHGATLTYWCSDVLKFPRLQRLRISGGSIRAPLALLFGQTTELESLSFGQCSTLRDNQLSALIEPLHKTLQELNVHQCLRIRRPRIELYRLEQLSFMGCFALHQLQGLFAPSLRELNLSFCFRLDTEEIQNAVEHIPCLETLTLVKCPLLESLHLHDKEQLRLLNVNYCNALTWLKVTDCPSLDALENTGCTSLYTLLLQGVDSLEYLNVSTLPIRRLVVTATRLLHLELENCRYLDDCCIRSPKLQRVNVRGSRTVALRFCKQIRSVLLENYWMTRTPMDI